MRRTRAKQEQRAVLTTQVRAAADSAGMDAMDGAALVERLSQTEGLIEWAATDTLLQRGSESVPALLTGLSHASGKIRATCALLLDHVADDRCISGLLQAIRHDPHESVRRCALHSLICDGCKECPLTTDVVSALIEVAGNDRSVAVRRRAVFYLSQQRPDARVAPFLESLLAREKDPVLLRRAENALKQHTRELVR